MGNMVGVSITKVHPAAGHVFSEILDLLIAVWSITVAGLVIGFISGFGCVSAMVNGADQSFHRRTAGLNFDEFQTLCASKGVKLTVPRIREIFDEAHVDGSNIIESSKVEELLSRMRNEVEGGPLSSGLSIAALITRMDEIDTKIGKLVTMVENIEGVEHKLVDEGKSEVCGNLQLAAGQTAEPVSLHGLVRLCACVLVCCRARRVRVCASAFVCMCACVRAHA